MSRSSSSKPQAVPGGDSRHRRDSSAIASSRHSSISRLASPIPGMVSPSVRQIPVPSKMESHLPTPLAGSPNGRTSSGPSRSTLAAALEGRYGRSPPRFGTPPVRAFSPTLSVEHDQGNGNIPHQNAAESHTVGHFPVNDEEAVDVVRRYIVQAPSGVPDPAYGSPTNHSILRGRGQSIRSIDQHNDSAFEDDFASLRLPGGDVTRQFHEIVRKADTRSLRAQRSKSFNVARGEPYNDTVSISQINVPGGFRREHLQRIAPSPAPSSRYGTMPQAQAQLTGEVAPKRFTANFIEFLTLYGHFAGEQLKEIEEETEDSDYFTSHIDEDISDRDDRDHSEERQPLMRTPSGRKPKAKKGDGGRWSAALLLLKSFVGTGVLFLPKAFSNGGMLFSGIVLLFVASLSYYCFILLANSRLQLKGSFGDMGGMMYGKWFRVTILTSIVLSQVGFVAAYIVFTSENLQSFILAVSDCRTYIDIKWMVLMQLIIFLPVSLLRDIQKLSSIALIADAFIFVGLLYLGYYDISTLSRDGLSPSVVSFNPRSWSLFIGTAIFTFEGIGLIIPIQESMKHPKQFPPVLAGVMVFITALFVGMGSLAYAAFGAETKTVVLLNMRQDDPLVNATQFLYSLAILLSTPLQLYPVIGILEGAFFTRSGKNSIMVKWRKNLFRFVIVMGCAFIAWGGANDLDKFVALVGSFACVPLVYIYPPMIHFKAVATTPFRKASDIILCCFGLVVMVYTTTLTLMSWTTSSGPPPPGYCDQRHLSG